MPARRPPHPIAAALGLGLAVALASLPGFAEAPTPVTFQPQSFWAQEIGSVTRTDAQRDYTVSIAPGKILQINLVTRNPNVFFRVKDATHGDRLLDSYQTGATTWSAKPASETTDYAIEVYVDPSAISRSDTAKYALQVGQYAPSDIKSRPADGAQSATMPATPAAAATATPAAPAAPSASAPPTSGK